MPRKPRIHFEEALYHVTVRGVNDKKIFKKKSDKKLYLELIDKYKEKYNFKLYAYCIMKDNADLVIQVKDIPLSKIMQGIQQVFTKKYNKKYNRKGSAFHGRYKAVLCDMDKLLTLVRYVHRTPIREGKKKGLYYKWISHKNYKDNIKDGLVDIDLLLKSINHNKYKAINSYVKLMGGNEDISEKKLREKVKLKNVEEHINEFDYSIKINFDMSYIFEKVCNIMDEKIENIKSGRRIRKYSDIRKAVIILGKKYSDASNRKISEILGVSESLVSKVISGNYKKTKRLKYITNEFIKSIS